MTESKTENIRFISTSLWCKTHTYGTNFDAPGGPFDKLSLFGDAQRWESKILPRLYFYIRAENHLMYRNLWSQI